MEEAKRLCDYCENKWAGWTQPAYSKHEILQIGCWGCSSLYNIVEDEYMLIGQRHGHYIFWKDLLRQWDKVMNKYASSAKKKDT